MFATGKLMSLFCLCAHLMQGQDVWHTAKVDFAPNKTRNISVNCSLHHYCCWAVILCSSFIFTYLTITCVPSLTPCTLIFCFFTYISSLKIHTICPPLFPLSIHSPSSPHFTTSLSDYADLSEPPRKKDWVFWGCQISGHSAQQWQTHVHT